MRFTVILLFAIIIICRHGSDGWIFGFASGVINGIVSAHRHRQITGKLDNIQSGINSHRRETAQGFREVGTALWNIKGDIQRWGIEARHNYQKTSAKLDTLQGSIDANHREVLLNFAASFDLFYYIGSNLNMVSTSVNSILDLVSSQKETNQHSGPDLSQLNENVHKLNDYFGKIDASYENFLEYAKDTSAYNNNTLLNFAMSSLSHDGDSPMSTLKSIHDLFLRSDGLLFSFAKPVVNEYIVCSKIQTPQQMLFGLYEMAVIAELKALALMSFSHQLKEYFGKGSFAKEQDKETQSCRDRLNALGSTVEQTLETSRSYLWRCDSPTQRIGNDDYIQFTNFIQGSIASTFSSSAQCSDRQQYSLPCGSDIPKGHKCNGTVYGCKTPEHPLESVCLDTAPRLYKNIKLKFGKTYGEDIVCDDDKKIILKENCGYCLCYCDSTEAREQDRYISLEGAISNVDEGMVVTGARFVKHYDALHLQVQESTVGPMGLINSTTARWVPVGKNLEKFRLTRDKHAVDIDIFDGESGKVLTGMRFIEVSHGVTLEVQLTPYNPETGELDKSKSEWKGNMRRKGARVKINLENVKAPSAAHVATAVKFANNQYVEVTTTGLVEDFAQTVVPFFDSREVKPFTLVPLSGFGLQYKSSGDKYAGYVAPVLVSLNYADKVGKNIQVPKLESTDSTNVISRSVQVSSAMSWESSFRIIVIVGICTLHL